MLARECAPENAGVAGYAEAFRCVLSGKQASIQSRYLRTAILASLTMTLNSLRYDATKLADAPMPLNSHLRAR